MNKKTTFCENCRKDVFYTIKDEYMYADLKGENCNYHGRTATCNECDNEIFVNEINDYNLHQLYNEFRRQHNIIALEKIREIPEKYNIGKRPLSLLLGWGEQTFSRYHDGDMPTQQYSEILQKIYDDPNYYLSALENNKGKLKSQLTYEKSKLSTQTLINSQQILDYTKIDIVANYLLRKCEDITPLALQKLLYYVQGFYYAFMNQFIFEENCEARVHGPVFMDVYSKCREYRFDLLSVCNTADNLNLTVLEKAVIDSVIKNIGCYSGKILEAFTYTETPWLFTRGNLPASASTEKIIDKKSISDYFIAVKEKNNMLNPSDIGIYSKKMFEQISI